MDYNLHISHLGKLIRTLSAISRFSSGHFVSEFQSFWVKPKWRLFVLWIVHKRRLLVPKGLCHVVQLITCLETNSLNFLVWGPIVFWRIFPERPKVRIFSRFINILARTFIFTIFIFVSVPKSYGFSKCEIVLSKFRLFLRVSTGDIFAPTLFSKNYE